MASIVDMRYFTLLTSQMTMKQHSRGKISAYSFSRNPPANADFTPILPDITSMPSLTLTHHNRDQIFTLLNEKSGDESWFVACLCAAWCDTCCEYRARFDQLAARFPNLIFIWIDIEDQAAVVGDLDIENFPTLLVQYGDIVSFMGPVLPDLQLAERLLLAQFEQSQSTLLAQANLNDEHRQWQIECNLRQLLTNQ